MDFGKKGITLTQVLIVVAIIGGLSVIGGLGYIAYQNWFGKSKLAAEHYTSEQNCKEAGYYWYNGTCHSEQQVTDCGVSKSLIPKDVFNKEPDYFEKDDTLVCLGRHVLDNCSNARGVIETRLEGPITFKIKGSDKSSCRVKMKYGKAENIPSEDRKQYADKYISCSISFLKEIGNFQLTEEMPSPEELPGTYSATLYFMMGWATVGYTGEIESGHPDQGGCTGTLVDYLQEQVEPEEQDTVSLTKGFACKDVVDVSYSRDLEFGSFAVTWGEDPGQGYGRYSDNSWNDYNQGVEDTGQGYFKNEELKTVAISFPDQLKGGISIDYPKGILTLKCSNGETIDVYMPAFTDVPREGFITKSGEEFTKSYFYVGKDGSTYYDIKLTELARSSE